jgi:hypothetical protein|tara:strand:- start:49 stop:327 length:279 start_codon:yes stop_codon:yes gene_type:complete
LKNKQLNLKKYLWKKRLLLIKNNQENISQIKQQLNQEKKKVIDWKIKVIFFDDEYKYNVILVGFDGLRKLEDDNFDLNKIIKLISKMPMSNH